MVSVPKSSSPATSFYIFGSYSIFYIFGNRETNDFSKLLIKMIARIEFCWLRLGYLLLISGVIAAQFTRQNFLIQTVTKLTRNRHSKKATKVSPFLPSVL